MNLKREAKDGQLHPAAFIYFIIFLEGYIVLSAELLAIRLTLPFVDNGTDTVSILIASVLMPLACGYYAGGNFHGIIRKKLIHNLIIAGMFLTVGLSYIVIHFFFEFFTLDLGWRNRLGLTSLYALGFLVTPIFLLGQTIPLISSYFPRTRLPEAAGKILFFSTLGSFLGAILTTLFLMNMIGVSGTATITVGCIALLVFLLARSKTSYPTAIAGCFFILSVGLNSPTALKKLNIISSNAYNTVAVEDYEDVRYFRLNRTYASALNPHDPSDPVFEYIKYIDRHFIRRFYHAGIEGKILVLGAGGFTIGLNDTHNHYVFVDIDPYLKDIAEDQFLGQKLGDNKLFIAEPARSYLNTVEQQFHLIIVDLFRDLAGPPDHLVTVEFFQQIKSKLMPDGIVIINQLTSPMMDDPYSIGIDNTIRSVFPHINRIPLHGFSPWKETEKPDSSVLYIARNPQNRINETKYWDNLNRAVFDRTLQIPRQY